MACLRATFLATTAVGLMALATPAFAEVIMTLDGHYYRLIPLKAPPGQASSVVMAIPEGRRRTSRRRLRGQSTTGSITSPPRMS